MNGKDEKAKRMVRVGKYTIEVLHDGSHKDCIHCQAIKEVEDLLA